MRPRHVIGAGIILGAFAVIAILVYFGNQELYLTVDELAAAPSLYRSAGGERLSAGEPASPTPGDGRQAYGRRLQVRGSVEDSTVVRARDGLEIRFMLVGDSARVPVVYHGVIPDTFDQAEAITVGGRVDSAGVFQADDLLVQCPSKYEAATPGAASPLP